MPRLTLNLQFTTPAFLTGADNRTPDLRVPSIRGALRYWLRAAVGAVVGDDLGRLHAAERAVFGNPQRASPLDLRLHVPQPLPVSQYRPVPHSLTFRAPAFEPDSEFRLDVVSRMGQSDLPPPTLNLLILWLSLGGLGKRARRGFGSLQMTCHELHDIELTRPDELLMKYRTRANVANGEVLFRTYQLMMSQVSQSTQAFVGLPVNTPVPVAIPAYPTLSEEHAKVLVCRAPMPPADSHPRFAGFGDEDDHLDAMLPWWEDLRSPAFLDNHAYGFAYPGRRRASPLHLSIQPSDKGLHLVMTAFRSHSEPLHPTGAAGWNKIQRFLDHCASRWNGDYVLGGSTSW